VIPGKNYSPQDVLSAAWRRRWWISLSFAILAAASLYWATSLPRRYQSLATLQAVPESVNAYLGTNPAARTDTRLTSIAQSTLTRARLEAIIKDLDLYPQMRQATVMENVVEQMRGDITVRSTERDMFVLGFTAGDPHLALNVSSRLTALFLEENARDRGQAADAATGFLAAQLADVRAKLDAQERQVEAYKAKYAGELPSQLPYNVQDLNSSQTTLRTLLDAVSRDQDQRLLLQGEQDTLRATGAGLPADGATGAGMTDADRLEVARADLRALELHLTPEHPDVERAKRAVARLETQLASGRPASAGPAPPTAAERRRDLRLREIQGQLDVLNRRVASNQAEMVRVRARIDEHSRRVDNTPLREAEFAALTRDYEDTKKLHSSLTSRQQDAAMAASLQRKDLGDRFRVIEPAQLPEKPFGQSRSNALLFALALAVGISVSLGAFVEYRDNSLRSEEDVMVGLRLPVLAAIPNLRTTVTRGSR